MRIGSVGKHTRFFGDGALGVGVDCYAMLRCQIF